MSFAVVPTCVLAVAVRAASSLSPLPSPLFALHASLCLSKHCQFPEVRPICAVLAVSCEDDSYRLLRGLLIALLVTRLLREFAFALLAAIPSLVRCSRLVHPLASNYSSAHNRPCLCAVLRRCSGCRGSGRAALVRNPAAPRATGLAAAGAGRRWVWQWGRRIWGAGRALRCVGWPCSPSLLCFAFNLFRRCLQPARFLSAGCVRAMLIHCLAAVLSEMRRGVPAGGLLLRTVSRSFLCLSCLHIRPLNAQVRCLRACVQSAPCRFSISVAERCVIRISMLRRVTLVAFTVLITNGACVGLRLQLPLSLWRVRPACDGYFVQSFFPAALFLCLRST